MIFLSEWALELVVDHPSWIAVGVVDLLFSGGIALLPIYIADRSLKRSQVAT